MLIWSVFCCCSFCTRLWKSMWDSLSSDKENQIVIVSSEAFVVSMPFMFKFLWILIFFRIFFCSFVSSNLAQIRELCPNLYKLLHFRNKSQHQCDQCERNHHWIICIFFSNQFYAQINRRIALDPVN